jgi:hypothetical protein
VVNAKIVVLTGNGLYPLVEVGIDMIVLGDAAVIFERVEPGRLRQLMW